MNRQKLFEDEDSLCESMDLMKLSDAQNIKPQQKNTYLVKFNNPDLLEEALTHPTYYEEQKYRSFLSNKNTYKHNQRLEFLGDSVLGMIMAEFFFKTNKSLQEKELTNLKNDIVQESNLANLARFLKLDTQLKLGVGAEQQKLYQLNSTMCDVFEAYIGAVFLDQGFLFTKQYVLQILEGYKKYQQEQKKLINGKNNVNTKLENSQQENIVFNEISNPKGTLQEYISKQFRQNNIIKYNHIHDDGPDHDKKFTVQLLINNKLICVGEGKNKKQAEQQAACVACKKFKCY